MVKVLLSGIYKCMHHTKMDAMRCNATRCDAMSSGSVGNCGDVMGTSESTVSRGGDLGNN